MCVLCVGVIALVPWKTFRPFLLFWIPKALSSRYAPSTNFWHHVTWLWMDSKIYEWSSDLKFHESRSHLFNPTSKEIQQSVQNGIEIGFSSEVEATVEHVQWTSRISGDAQVESLRKVPRLTWETTNLLVILVRGFQSDTRIDCYLGMVIPTPNNRKGILCVSVKRVTVSTKRDLISILGENLSERWVLNINHQSNQMKAV